MLSSSITIVLTAITHVAGPRATTSIGTTSLRLTFWLKAGWAALLNITYHYLALPSIRDFYTTIGSHDTYTYNDTYTCHAH